MPWWLAPAAMAAAQAGASLYGRHSEKRQIEEERKRLKKLRARGSPAAARMRSIGGRQLATRARLARQSALSTMSGRDSGAQAAMIRSRINVGMAEAGARLQGEAGMLDAGYRREVDERVSGLGRAERESRRQLTSNLVSTAAQAGASLSGARRAHLADVQRKDYFDWQKQQATTSNTMRQRALDLQETAANTFQLPDGRVVRLGESPVARLETGRRSGPVPYVTGPGQPTRAADVASLSGGSVTRTPMTRGRLIPQEIVPGMQRAPDQFTLGTGQKRYDEHGKVIAEGPVKATDPKRYNLAPGEILFGPGGKEIARGSPKVAGTTGGTKGIPPGGFKKLDEAEEYFQAVFDGKKGDTLGRLFGRAYEGKKVKPGDIRKLKDAYSYWYLPEGVDLNQIESAISQSVDHLTHGGFVRSPEERQYAENLLSQALASLQGNTEILDPKIREKMIEYEESSKLEGIPRYPQARLSGRAAGEKVSKAISSTMRGIWEAPMHTLGGPAPSLRQRWDKTKHRVGTAYDWFSGFSGK